MEIKGVEKREEKEMRQAFTEKVYQIVKQVPKGKVATYGWIATKLGKPKATRAVGNALHRNPDPKNIPCHRVVDRNGRLAPNYGLGGWKAQKRKLLKEGVKFKDKTCVDLGKHLWQKYI